MHKATRSSTFYFYSKMYGDYNIRIKTNVFTFYFNFKRSHKLNSKFIYTVLGFTFLFVWLSKL